MSVGQLIGYIIVALIFVVICIYKCISWSFPITHDKTSHITLNNKTYLRSLDTYQKYAKASKNYTKKARDAKRKAQQLRNNLYVIVAYITTEANKKTGYMYYVNNAQADKHLSTLLISASHRKYRTCSFQSTLHSDCVLQPRDLVFTWSEAQDFISNSSEPKLLAAGLKKVSLIRPKYLINKIFKD